MNEDHCSSCQAGDHETCKFLTATAGGSACRCPHETDTPEQIVRDLAAMDAPIHDEWNTCELCYAGIHYHEPSCPWRRAVEWEAANQKENS